MPSIRKAAARIFTRLCIELEAEDYLDVVFIDEILKSAGSSDLVDGPALEQYLREYLVSDINSPIIEE